MTTLDIVLILLLGVIKIPIVGMLLWMPMRSDPVEWAQSAEDASDGEGEDEEGGGGGGGGTRRQGPHRRPPRPGRPRRGPHPGARPAPPARIRAVGRRVRVRARV
ncbi:MAG TPA: hypothetical protein VHX88_11790 [Solirubrobacteraceae bacterium]|jgi:hypothetical protein|nr:hypothetical protein [Solirubrobacteraceae bacterium]